jgi:hypothetical protein
MVMTVPDYTVVHCCMGAQKFSNHSRNLETKGSTKRWDFALFDELDMTNRNNSPAWGTQETSV